MDHGNSLLGIYLSHFLCKFFVIFGHKGHKDLGPMVYFEKYLFMMIPGLLQFLSEKRISQNIKVFSMKEATGLQSGPV